MSAIHPRPEMEARKERAALWSILASVVITLGKGAAGLATGSLALISDAVHSLLDVAATTMTWVALRAAHKPADDEHHYGHGKVESLAALVETALLFLLSGAVAYEGLRRLATGQSNVETSWAAVGVLLAAIAVDGWRWWSLKRIAQETGSDALAADALHFSTDLVNSVLVLGALAAAAYGYPQADALVAVGVSIFIAVAGLRLAKRTIDALLDAAPRGVADQVRSAAAGVPGVVSVERVRVRPAGGRHLGEITVHVSRTLPFEQVSSIKRRIEAALADALPGSEFTITADPTQLSDETVFERVMLIAAKRRVPVHHIIVQEIEGRRTVSLDVEVDRAMSLGRAHALASGLEDAIKAELGPGVEVDTHIEPIRVDPIAGREESRTTVGHIADALQGAAREVGDISDVHSVRVRRLADGLIVNYHCRFDPHATVASVHERVDELERRFRATHPEVLRVIGHAEPVRG